MGPAADRARGLLDHLRPSALFRRRDPDGRITAPRDPATSKRNIQYVSFRRTKREAQVKLGELVAAVGHGSYIEPSKVTVAEHLRVRVDQWEAAYDPAAKTGISPKTAERYRELIENQIAPHIGAKLMQKLKAADIEAWHTTLRTSGRKDGKGGVSTRTIKHARRILSKALDDAVRNDLVGRTRQAGRRADGRR